MERLSDNALNIINELHTEKLDYNSEYLPLIDAANSLAAYEDTGLDPEQIKDMAENVETRLLTWFESRYGFPVGELMDLLESKQDGRLVALPCGVNDTAWYADKDADRVLMGYVSSYQLLSDGAIYFDFTNVESDVEWVSVELPIEDFGKTVFLTSEEAEAALQKEKEP